MREGSAGRLDEKNLDEHHGMLEGTPLPLSSVQSYEQQRSPTTGCGSDSGPVILTAQTESPDIGYSKSGTQVKELNLPTPDARRQIPARDVRVCRPILSKACQGYPESEASGTRSPDDLITVSKLDLLQSAFRLEESEQRVETDNTPTSVSGRTESNASLFGFTTRCDCRAVFEDFDSLRLHNEQAHNRRYHCLGHCTKSFTAKRSLKRHTKETKCYCPHAGCVYSREGFKRREFLKKHLFRKHRH